MVPRVEGNYDFSWSYVDGNPLARRTGPGRKPPIVKFMRQSPTFRAEFDAGTSAGYYEPERVLGLRGAGLTVVASARGPR